MLRVKVTYQGLRFSAVIKSILPYNTVITEDKKYISGSVRLLKGVIMKLSMSFRLVTEICGQI